MNAVQPTNVPLVPIRQAVFGPLVRKRVRRLMYALFALYATGVALSLTDISPFWTAFGLGLQFPGAGFLYVGGWLGIPLFLLTLVLFGLAFFAWFGAGMIVAPPAVWLAAAAGAGWLARPDSWTTMSAVVPAVVASGAVLVVYKRWQQHKSELMRAEERNRYLAVAVPAKRDLDIEAGAEMSDEELASLRYLLELGLQPVEMFDGFEFRDQFQSAATRYQIDYAQYGLAIAQYTRTPAFRGYMQQAQANLIEKKLDKRIWSYWFWENLWGNFRLNPDPIAFDNVMYSGNTAMMLGLYETINQHSRFCEPESLPFRWNAKRAFAYDFHSMCEALADNYRRSDLGMMVCEPNWLYNMCNCIGMTGLMLHDRLHGSNYIEELFPRTRQSLHEEFLTGDGRCVAIRSSRFGITLPNLTSMTSDANFIWYLNALDPAHADRLWTILRHEFAKLTPEGELDLVLVGPDKLDIGNYKSGVDMGGCTVLMETAAEMGDLELWRALKSYIEGRYSHHTVEGVRRFDVSAMLNIVYVMALFARPNVWRDMVTRGIPQAWQKGPLLAEAKYPDVLVTRAVSDGKDLDLVLRPGNGSRRVQLGIERLVPNTRYDVRGLDSSLVADVQGRASLELDLAERRSLRLVAS